MLLKNRCPHAQILYECHRQIRTRDARAGQGAVPESRLPFPWRLDGSRQSPDRGKSAACLADQARTQHGEDQPRPGPARSRSQQRHTLSDGHQPSGVRSAALWREGEDQCRGQHRHRLADRLGPSRSQRLCDCRGSDPQRQGRGRARTPARSGAVPQRLGRGGDRTQAQRGVDWRGYPPAHLKSEARVQRLVFQHRANGLGRQRHRGPALWHHRHARDFFPAMERR